MQRRGIKQDNGNNASSLPLHSINNSTNTNTNSLRVNPYRGTNSKKTSIVLLLIRMIMICGVGMFMLILFYPTDNTHVDIKGSNFKNLQTEKKDTTSTTTSNIKDSSFYIKKEEMSKHDSQETYIDQDDDKNNPQDDDDENNDDIDVKNDKKQDLVDDISNERKDTEHEDIDKDINSNEMNESNHLEQPEIPQKEEMPDTSPPPIEYPSPLAQAGADSVKVVLEPTFGHHHPHNDAIFAFAEGYDMKIYLAFIESLVATGFEGDLVLSVSAIKSLKPGVEEYLRSHADVTEGINVVVYTVTWTCFDGQGNEVEGAKEGIRMCELGGMYFDEVSEEILKDPREARPVATARYELYWAWSLQYESHNWMMLIDSRDTYFQLDPFTAVERESDTDKKDGLLYLFGENHEASDIGSSTYNRKWLETAYGKDVVSPFMSNTIICSGSTMGEQVAIESYLRAMVAEFDNTKCKQKGCDQGFHNYLHYSGGLSNVKGIREVKVFDQGKGIINNLGVLRAKPLSERGVFNNSTMQVINWDGNVSPVAHQFDRDDELNKYIKQKKADYVKQWSNRAK